MKDKLIFLLRVLYGEFLKTLVKLNIIRPQYGVRENNCDEEKVVVSLTSYGRRVNKVVYCTIVSLLRQSYKPDHIVLWLDNDNWSKDNVPSNLKRLYDYGLEIRFCDDYRSFKKLLPSLKEFPGSIIITCDDDMYYSKDFVRTLVNEHKRHPNCICSLGGEVPTVGKDGKLIPFMEWPCPKGRREEAPFTPVGFCGILYKKDLLHKDITNYDLCSRLSPNADDLWFYIMEVMAKTKCILIKRREPYPVDYIYQKIHSSSLTASNCGENQNDIQLKNIMDYYKITPKDLFY